MAKRLRPVSGARWALQDAKNRLSEVVDAALRGEPQVVTRRGVETAVVMSHAEYTRMNANAEHRQPLAAYLLDIPRKAAKDDVVVERITLRPRRGA